MVGALRAQHVAATTLTPPPTSRTGTSSTSQWNTTGSKARDFTAPTITVFLRNASSAPRPSASVDRG